MHTICQLPQDAPDKFSVRKDTRNGPETQPLQGSV
jgi:hypothetical protein